MSDFEYTALTEEHRKEFAITALRQLEAQLFECQMNMDLYGHDVRLSEPNEFAYVRRDRLVNAIDVLKKKYVAFLP